MSDQQEPSLYDQIIREMVDILGSDDAFEAECLRNLQRLIENKELHRPESVMAALREPDE